MENYINNNFKTIIHKFLRISLVFITACFVVVALYSTGAPKYVLASLLNGFPISNSNHYAYGENIGWVDFNPTGGNVQVGDNGLTGYAYGENIGWINLGNSNGPPYSNTSSTDWGVNNDGNGILSGYAYGENVGWVSFNPTGGGVTINNTTGAFSGYAYGENIGWVSFSGTGYGVVGDWAVINGPGGGKGTGINYYTISAQSGANGSISPTSAYIAYGSNQTFTIVSASGYQVADILVDGKSVGAVATYTFSNITASHTISATFSAVANNTPTNTIPSQDSMSSSDTINYINNVLKQMRTLLSAPQNSPLYTQPTTQPPSNLQPTQPPPNQTTTTTTTNNQEAIIQVMQKLLKALQDLLGMVSR